MFPNFNIGRDWLKQIIKHSYVYLNSYDEMGNHILPIPLYFRHRVEHQGYRY